jgi:nucleoid-associated protein Lsr2
MAQKVQTLYVDDIDGSEAAGAVRFALDGIEYEIDLSTAHNEALHTALGPYIAHARKIGRTAGRATRGARATGTSAVDTQAVRSWAKEQGIDIKDRGRVPAEIIAKYRAATGR